ncbi:MAG: YceD family protein [Rhodanobacteraceae bacterium]|nr:YceD family protein [Pseudomonadota bacterium]
MSALPSRVDAERMVAARRVFHGSLPVASMPRLAAALADDRGEVEYELQFGIDALDTPCVKMHAKAVLILQCQRSLQTFEWPVEIEQRLGLIADECDEAGLPPGVEPLLLDDGTLDPAGAIEDELLLSLPSFPVKPGNEMEALHWERGNHAVPVENAETETHPFAILRELKQH